MPTLRSSAPISPAGHTGKTLTPIRIGVVGGTDPAHRRQRREALAETLHAPALMIHGDQQCRRSQRPNLGNQVDDLRRRAIVTVEQYDTPNRRLEQQRAVRRTQRLTVDVEHYWTE